MPGLIVASAAFVQGCIEPDVTSGPRGTIDAEYARAAVGDDYDLGEDAHMMELARQVPGFAGFHYEPGSEDRMVVAMRRRDRDGFPSARSAVAGLMAGSLGDAAVFVQHRVDYSFLELAANRALLRPRLFALPGVASLSVDEEANRIAIGVSDGSVVPAVEALADDLGVPHKMLAFELGVQPIAGSSGIGVAPRSDDVAQTLDLEDQIDTLQSGYMATSHRGECTIGPTGTVGRGNPTGRPTQVFFSNAHCTWIQFDHDYENPNWGQPHWGWTVGREWGDPAPRRCWKLLVKWDCREADAAVIYVDPNAPFAREIALGKIARTKLRTNDVGRLSIEIHSVPTITINGVRHWNVKNEILDKVGRVTGWTYGPVKKTCDDIWGTFGGRNMLILCSDRVDYIRRGGDSGSPVFQYNNGYAQLRGIHYHSGGHMSDLEQIKKDFDRWYPGVFDQTWFYDPGPPRYPSIGGPREVPPSDECSWEAHARGMEPFVYQWSGILSGTKKRVRGSVGEPGYLVVSIRDVLWREVRDSIWVSVSNEAERCTPPPPPIDPIDSIPPPPN